jgi:prevent-host-death family protein
MMVVTLEDARNRLGDLVNTARLSGEPTTITRYGKPEVVLVPVGWYEEAAEALSRTGDGPVTASVGGDQA